MSPENTSNKLQGRLLNRFFVEFLNRTGFVSPPAKHISGYADGIVDLLRAKAGEKPDLPISLSSMAGKFLINPQPDFNLEYIFHAAEIDFLPDQDKFVIKMKPHLLTTSADELNGFDDTQLTASGRFTYAHEIAHRFFFIPTGKKWNRAINLLMQERGYSRFTSIFYYLRNQEENYCSQIARKVLVPADMVASFATDHPGAFIPRISQEFLVPIPSALLAWRDAMQKSYLTKDPAIFVMYLCAVMRKEEVRYIQINASVGPFAGNNLNLRTPFLYKASTEVLGYHLRDLTITRFCDRVFQDDGSIDIPLILRNKQGEKVWVRLQGGWQPLADEEFFRSGLLWGHII